MSLHHDMKPIPTDPAERKTRVNWILDHKVWTHPFEYPLRKRASAWERGLADPDGVIRGLDGDWSRCVDLGVQYVDPATERIEDDEVRNTAFRVWLEGGPWHDRCEDEHDRASPDALDRWIPSRDMRLDCGGPDLETALLELARRVEFFYDDEGRDREGAPKECPLEKVGDPGEADGWRDACTYDESGFCTECGFTENNHPECAEARERENSK